MHKHEQLTDLISGHLLSRITAGDSASAVPLRHLESFFFYHTPPPLGDRT